MELPKRILVPFDFSSAATRAFQYATSIAKPLRASVVVLHVHEPDRDEPLQKDAGLAAEALDALLRTQAKTEVDLTSLIRVGRASATINRAAEEVGADLIVMGTHGRKWIARAVLGSVAEATLRESPRPVVMIHAPEEEAPPAYVGLPKRIVVATDFSDTAERAIAYAVHLASANGARVSVAHAYAVPALAAPDGVIGVTPMIGQIIEAAQQALEAAVQPFIDRGAKLDVELLEGHASEAINAYAGSVDADLIVVGTRGRGGIGRVLLGSVAESVIREATRPVLAIRG